MFYQKKKWPGIEEKKIYRFYVNLKKNYHEAINDFLSLQIIDSKENLKDLKKLKKMLFYQDKPNKEILKNGLEILLSTDLRFEKKIFNIPLLRIYGSLDNLVPKKISKILDKEWPSSKSIIIEKAAHTPFISHKEEFCFILEKFIKETYF